MIALEGLQHLVDVAAIEPSDIALIVDVTRGGTDHHQSSESLGRGDRRQGADHRTHRVTDENHVVQVERFDDGDDIGCIALERAVLVWIE